MNKIAKILVSVGAIFITSLIIAAISNTNSNNRPGVLGVIIVLGLLAALTVIWKKDHSTNDNVEKKVNKSIIGFKDYYNILDISSSSNLKEIEFAYSKLLKLNNNKVIDEIHEAHEILKDSQLRSRYDAEYFRYHLLTNPKNNYNNIKPADFSYNDESLTAFIKKIRNKSVHIQKADKTTIVDAGKSAAFTILQYFLICLFVGGIIILFVRGCNNNHTSAEANTIYDTIDSTSIPKERNFIVDTTSSIENIKSDSSTYSSPITENKSYYGIAIFYLKSKQSKSVYIVDKYYEQYDYTKTASEIFELTDISEDEKYKKLDQIQKEKFLDSNSFYNITNRELKIFDSYAEASIEREKILNINQNN
ncbi:MAG: DnaJ domain [Chryseobacterium sp.]|jgi:hypothetical protein|uniref:hypothetical protein n=1 Tax=Chryseobacterium sp. TaxID=1871047 RepID=UPI00262E8589|nr:hypothetical protein [Chryseobacterium sp.]MDF2552866.1 DnaJ domain [Chryseobacterium sp.]